MILFRYLIKEVSQATAAVTVILLLIVTSGRLAKYLAQSSSGHLSSDVVFWVILFRIPDFLPLILPLGFFIGVLLAYGRLYVDNEMIVMNACGTGKKRLVTITAIPAILMSMLVAYLTLFGAPSSLNKVQSILQNPANTNSLAILQEGKFQETSDGQRVIYAEKFDPNSDAVNDVWMVEHRRDGSVIVIRADSGRISDNADLGGGQYLTLDNGSVYDGFVGKRDYQITEFASYSQKVVERRRVEKLQLEGDAKTTRALFMSDKPSDIAALHWRFSLPVVVLVVALLALALSKTNQRSGRYIKMLPAVLIYLLYIVAITGVRNKIEMETQPPLMIWLVHGLFFIGALMLLLEDDFKRLLAARKSRAAI
ncbi:MAG TPA: LPS export ABC transporter permease LptF [Cellvibrionales bacterium]|jgi:lipopolysaccharide export system permease protein|nr:LPS export ABC transporter permease LptF [Cellvibrionales bacterium]HCX26780.1 LPS export ABC transporter permease LptF [Cellvibrionales bacterium]